MVSYSLRHVDFCILDNRWYVLYIYVLEGTFTTNIYLDADPGLFWSCIPHLDLVFSKHFLLKIWWHSNLPHFNHFSLAQVVVYKILYIVLFLFCWRPGVFVYKRGVGSRLFVFFLKKRRINRYLTLCSYFTNPVKRIHKCHSKRRKYFFFFN